MSADSGGGTSSSGTRPDSRARAIEVAAVEVVALAGTAGDELDARQAAVIKEILQWLSRRQDPTRSG